VGLRRDLPLLVFSLILVFVGYSAFVVLRGIQRQQDALAQQEREQEFLKQLIVKRRNQLQAYADEARDHLENKRFAEGLTAVGYMLEMDPGNERAEELRREIRLAQGLAKLAPVKGEAEARWNQVRDLDRGQTFAGPLDELDSAVRAAETLVEGFGYEEAIGQYQEILTECRRLLALEQEREQARQARAAMLEARGQAEATQAAADAAELWQGAEALRNEGAVLFENGEFPQAVERWAEAAEGFAGASARAVDVQAARAARAAYEAAVAAVDTGLVTAHAKEMWDQITASAAAADALLAEEKRGEAVARWNEAAAGIPAVVEAALTASRQAAFNAYLGEGRTALNEKRWDDAAAAFQAALQVPGFEAEAEPQAALAAIRVERLMEQVRAAEEQGEWETVLNLAREVLALDAANGEAATLEQRAADELVPRLTVVSSYGGQEVTDARIFLDGEEMGERTPATFALEKDRTYRIRVVWMNPEGTYPLTTVTDYTVASFGSQRYEAAVVSPSLPEDLELVSDTAYAPLEGLGPGSFQAQLRQKQAVENLVLPLEVRTRGTGIRLRLIPAGDFAMGSQMGEASERPIHRVTLSKAFYAGMVEVTQEQWHSVMAVNPAKYRRAGRTAPVERVTWSECEEFCRRLCRREGVPAGTYRMLTEAEWEYCCRAGTRGLYAGPLEEMAWYGNAYSSTRPTGTRNPNGWGLYDMHGNVSEWCLDWYGAYSSEHEVDPRGPYEGRQRVYRGGSWAHHAAYCRSAFRFRYDPEYSGHLLGLRIMRVLPEHPDGGEEEEEVGGGGAEE
jgi:formylglycine-generating enzyme required for sulfatase activity